MPLAVTLTTLARAHENPVSYTRDIKPIFDSKCVGCHSCFDAPAQPTDHAKGSGAGLQDRSYAIRYEGDIIPIPLDNTLRPSNSGER